MLTSLVLLSLILGVPRMVAWVSVVEDARAGDGLIVRRLPLLFGLLRSVCMRGRRGLLMLCGSWWVGRRGRMRGSSWEVVILGAAGFMNWVGWVVLFVMNSSWGRRCAR